MPLFLFSANHLEKFLNTRPHFVADFTHAMNLESAEELGKFDSDLADLSTLSWVNCIAICSPVFVYFRSISLIFLGITLQLSQQSVPLE